MVTELYFRIREAIQILQNIDIIQSNCYNYTGPVLFLIMILFYRVTDRMAALVFTKGLSGEYSSQQQTLTDLQKSNVKPFEFMIGTVGDYIHSPQFKEDVRR